MPFFSFHCADCEGVFEDLVRPDEVPPCPSCGGTHVDKLLACAAKPASAGEPVPMCGGCGGMPGSCMERAG